MHAIAGSLLGSKASDGIERFVWCSANGGPSFALYCLSAPTGIKLLLSCDPNQARPEDALRQIYLVYCTWVLKNPFYTVDMPIKIDAFNAACQAKVQDLSTA